MDGYSISFFDVCDPEDFPFFYIMWYEYCKELGDKKGKSYLNISDKNQKQKVWVALAVSLKYGPTGVVLDFLANNGITWEENRTAIYLRKSRRGQSGEVGILNVDYDGGTVYNTDNSISVAKYAVTIKFELTDYVATFTISNPTNLAHVMNIVANQMESVYMRNNHGNSFVRWIHNTADKVRRLFKKPKISP